MKKFLLVLALSAVAGSASAYSLIIKNKSNYVLMAKAYFGGPGICGEKVMRVEPKDTYIRETDICCLADLKITTVDYKGKGRGAKLGKSIVVDGRETGLGLSCRNNTFEVTVTSNGTVIAEQK